MYPDRTAWLAAGGDAFRLDLYATIGAVGPFATGSSRALATVHPALPELGCIGDWVGSTEVLRAAEAWLRTQGCTTVHGPKELCAWFNSRASLGPFDTAPFAWEPTSPAQPWLDAGYLPLQHYISVLADHHSHISRGSRDASSLSAKGWRIESLPTDAKGHIPDGLFREALGVVHQLFSAGYAHTDEFAPVPLEALHAYYGRYRTELDPRLTLLAFEPSGRPAGAILAIPDSAQPERGWFQIMKLAVVPEHRATGLGNWLVAACHKAARDAGFTAGVHALVRLDDPKDTSWITGTILRRHALLAKEL